MVLVRTGLAFVEPFDLDSGFQCGYCYRHDFQTAKDRTLHECNSHLVCMKQGCRKQYDSPQDLIQHCRETKCSFVCRGCRTFGKIWHFNITGYWNHIQEQNVCTKCERHFDTQSNLIHHKLTHRTPTYACLGINCERVFTTYGGMILHLEANTCPSQIDIVDLGYSAAKCFQWSKFIVDSEIRDLLLANQFVYDQPGYPGLLVFEYPTCRVEFPKLSSLFMHVESPACAQGLGEGAIGKLRKWLVNRHS